MLVPVGAPSRYRMTLQYSKVEKSDRLGFSPGTCLFIEKRYNIVTQNMIDYTGGLSVFSLSIDY